MCGIIGYIGYKEVQPILLNSLKRLEYRGYDSCGIAILDQGISVYKDVGRVESLKINLPPSQGKIGIGHTRWATHGGVSKANAHPHLDCNGKVAVVHNGVIDNFHRLREQLIQEGHYFRSETDTEVIPHLIEKYYQGNLEKAVVRALNDIVGSFAIIVIHADCPYLVAARRESPLIIGVKDRESFVASDIAAVLDYTDTVLYLEDGDVSVVSEKGVTISNKGRRVTRKKDRVPWSIEEVQKAGYEHFMLKEIHEQPRVMENTLEGCISAIEPVVNLGIERDIGFKDIVLIACGTSYHAALIGEYFISRLARIPVGAKVASEFTPYDVLLDKTWAIGITQSGETADTIKALRRAKELGCKTLVITNVPGSSATRIADQTLYIRAGLEISVAATKSFIAQLTVLYLLALSYAIVDTRARQSLIEKLRHLPAKAQQILDEESQIAQHARCLSKYKNAFFVARGINYPVALEGALKLKEVSYIHAEAYPAGELKHGPFALLHPDLPVIAIASPDDTYEAMLTNIKEIKARGSPLLALAEEKDPNIEQFADNVLWIPQVDPIFSPLLNSVVLQLLAYYIARERNCPIDLPANLAKSVTVP